MGWSSQLDGDKGNYYLSFCEWKPNSPPPIGFPQDTVLAVVLDAEAAMCSGAVFIWRPENGSFFTAGMDWVIPQRFIIHVINLAVSHRRGFW